MAEPTDGSRAQACADSHSGCCRNAVCPACLPPRPHPAAPPPPPPRFLSGDGAATDAVLSASAAALGLEPLESEYLVDERGAHPLLPPWPLLGAAMARGLPHLLLGCFAAEGDNVPHAMEVAGCAVGLLGLTAAAGPSGSGEASPALRVPCSFAALYGRTSGIDAFLG